jgi:hypothetical protein
MASLAVLMVVAPPTRQAVIGFLERLQPRLGFNWIEDEIKLIPRALDEAGRALSIDPAEVNRLCAPALFAGDSVEILPGHARCGNLVEIESLLKSFCHRAVAGNVSGGAQLHRIVVCDDKNVAWPGDEERAEP